LTKKISTKYTSDNFDEFQPGSRKKVLKNKLGITKVREIKEAEFRGYLDTEKKLIKLFTSGQKFKLSDIHFINKLFLGNLYDWAGNIRTVNLSKGNFIFATTFALIKLLPDFEKNILAENTPCSGKDLNEIAFKIAKVHDEFLLLHPYREGNGRTARLFATIMAYQAGLSGLDFSFIKNRGKQFESYISAIHEGMKQNYIPMQKIILKAIKLSIGKDQKQNTI